MLHVLESPSGPANCKEYFYSGVIEIKDHIAMVESEEAKTYLFHLGFRYLGDIEEITQLNTFLKARDPNAMPGDQDDVNYKRETAPPKTVEVKTIVPLDDVKPHVVVPPDDIKSHVLTPVTIISTTPKIAAPAAPETVAPETDLPAAGEPLERWWDK